jgi:hypothetical protein
MHRRAAGREELGDAEIEDLEPFVLARRARSALLALALLLDEAAVDELARLAFVHVRPRREGHLRLSALPGGWS